MAAGGTLEGWRDGRASRGEPEYREKDRVTEEEAKEIVRRAYFGVLGREPDAGSRSYVSKVMRDRWTEEDVARELRKSDEYRSKQR